MATAIGTSKTKYQIAYDVDLKAKMICGRTGIQKTWGELTDEDIQKIIDSGNKNFQVIPAKADASVQPTVTPKP